MTRQIKQGRSGRAACFALMFGVLLTGCWFEESRPGVWFIVTNDTEDPATVWIEHDGDEYEPQDADPHLGPGERATFGLSLQYASATEEGRVCSDGDIIARYDDGSEVRIPPPVCRGGIFSVSSYPRVP